MGWRLGNNKKPPSLCKSSSSYNIKESKSSILQVLRRKEASSGGGDSSSCPFSISDDNFKISACSICHIRRPFVGWRRDFTYAELHAATNGFSDRNFLSEGGFGSVYRGEIDGIRIAVKQHKLASSQGEKEFRSEVSVLSKVSHENLVMLLGTCREATRRLLLVYEYVCHGSLEKHLSSKDFRMELGNILCFSELFKKNCLWIMGKYILGYLFGIWFEKLIAVLFSYYQPCILYLSIV